MPGFDVLNQSPAVVIVGDSQVGKRTLLQKLPGVGVPAPDGSVPFSLDTKYYTAIARLITDGNGGQSLSHDNNAECEAILLVFDCTRWAAFTLL